MNLEHSFIEDEAKNQDDELFTEDDHIEHAFDATFIQEKMMAEATKKANKILKKNKREIERLKRHAELCIYNNNYFGYSYAIKKLRDFYKQPYTEELIKTMWTTTRETLLESIRHYHKIESQK